MAKKIFASGEVTTFNSVVGVLSINNYKIKSPLIKFSYNQICPNEVVIKYERKAGPWFNDRTIHPNKRFWYTFDKDLLLGDNLSFIQKELTNLDDYPYKKSSYVLMDAEKDVIDAYKKAAKTAHASRMKNVTVLTYDENEFSLKIEF